MANLLASQVVDALVARIESVGDTGPVYDYDVVLEDAADVETYFLYTGVSPNAIRGWQVTEPEQDAVTQTPESTDQDAVDRLYDVIGFWEEDGDGRSAKAFRDKLDQVRAAVNAGDNLGLAGLQTSFPEGRGFVVQGVALRNFGNRRVHVALCSMQTRTLDT